MKKVLISVLISAMLMLAIPFLAVELLPPRGNAASTEPQNTAENTDK